MNLDEIKSKLELSGWWPVIGHLFQSDDFLRLLETLNKEYETSTVYPTKENIFKAFFITPFNNLRAVILGQDPYYVPDAANGLAFAVNPGSYRPPSLKNILRELEADFQQPVPYSACTLEGWAHQGVLLLNTSLTVREGEPTSHSDLWQKFTTEIIECLTKQKKQLAFLLWGEHAKSYKPHIKNHYYQVILEAGHPSPRTARLFLGCRHFSQTNEMLVEMGKQPINWYKINTLEEEDYVSSFGQVRTKSG